MKQQLTPQQRYKVEKLFDVYVALIGCAFMLGDPKVIRNETISGLTEDEKKFFLLLDIMETISATTEYDPSFSDFEGYEITGNEDIAWIEKFVTEQIETAEEIAQTNRDIREDEAFYRNREL